MSIHQGPAQVTGNGGAMKYSGETVELSRELLQICQSGYPLVSPNVTSEEEVAIFAHSAGLQFTVSDRVLPSRPDLLLHRIERAGPSL